MSGKIRASFLSLTIIAVLMFSAFGPTTVYADGDPPPEATETATDANTDSEDATAEAAPEAVDDSDQAAAQVTDAAETAPAEAEATQEDTEAENDPEAAPAETEAAGEVTTATGEVEAESTEAAPTTEEPPAADDADAVAAEAGATEETEASAEEAVSDPHSSVLDEVPEDTAVTVLDADGEAVPLATEAAAEAIAESDPVWCPAGVLTPTPGAGGCTPSFTSFDELLSELEANPATYTGAGTIFVEQGTYSGGESTIDFNAYSLGNISSANLTVTGGWNTTSGLVESSSPSTFDGIPIIIGSSASPWGGTLMISNISISDTDGTGLSLNASGNVILSNVDVTNAQNGAGTEIESGGNVTIVDSNFTRNKTAGARVKATGNVDVVASSFSNPPDARRQFVGLDVEAASVTLVDVMANENREVGANIIASGPVTVSNSFFSGTQACTPSTNGTCHANATFSGYGLQILTPGAIDLDGVTANDNFLWGAKLTTTSPGANIAIINSVFNANTTESAGFIDDTGLFITSAGAVDMTNVEASDNRLYGAQIFADGAVAITDSIFNNNTGIITTAGVTTYNGHGLQITSGSNISINSVTATGNLLFGAELIANTAGSEVAISNSTFSDTTGSGSNAPGTGLDITTAGHVSLFDVTLDNNHTFGAAIRAGGDITLTNVTATNNGEDGIVILQGTCTQVSGGAYTGNGMHGLNLGPSALDLLAPPAGDIFPANPASCSVLMAGSPGSNVFASLSTVVPAQQFSSNTGAASVSEGPTLEELMSKSLENHFGVFIGKYLAVYSDSGIMVYAFSPANQLAMGN